MFEIEKEKAKWSLEKDRLMQAVTEMRDKTEKLEEEKEKIRKELDKQKKIRNTA